MISHLGDIPGGLEDILRKSTYTNGHAQKVRMDYLPNNISTGAFSLGVSVFYSFKHLQDYYPSWAEIFEDKNLNHEISLVSLQ